jgi:phage major head subunit gpT-like protein
MISGNVPNHLLVAARTGFLTAVKTESPQWSRIAQMITMDAKSIDLVDLGDSPMPTEAIGSSEMQDYIEKKITIQPKNWEIVVSISHNAVMDDKTGTLESRVRGAGLNFNKHMNKLVFQALDAGDAATYGLCYDGKNFFANDHADPGADYQTAQDNLFGLALTIDNFETVKVATGMFMDDRGEYKGYMHDLLVVPPAYERIAAQICNNPDAYDTGNREANPYSGKVNYIVDPRMASTAWALVASSEAIKPILLPMREQPNLQAAWFDPNHGKDGGDYMFKFYARYYVAFGDWRLAALGNT